MFELPVTSYPMARILFAPLDHHLGPQAIFAKRLPGTVMVDNLLYPRAALTWMKHRIYVTGEPGPEFINEARQFIQTSVLPEAQAAGRERFLLYYPQGADLWANALLEGIEITQEWRLELEMGELKVDWRQLLPEKMLLQQVDEWLLRSKGLIGREAIVQAYTAEHSSLQEALRQEFGYSLIQRRLIIGRCLSEYAGEGRCEFGIFTHPEHRKAGLGTILAAAMVERAQFLGITRIGWHCWEKNRASSALAEKVGFERKHRYPVLTGKLV